MDMILSGVTNSGQSVLGNNGNEAILYIPLSSTDWSLVITWFIILSRTLDGEVLLFWRDAAFVFYWRLYSIIFINLKFIL